MAISRLSGQDAKGTSISPTVSAVYPGATTANNLLIAVVFANTLTSTFTAPSGFSSAVLQDFGAASPTRGLAIYYKLADGTETTITGSASGAANMKIHIFEYTGNANPIALDGTNGASSGASTVTSLASGNITTTNAADLIFAAFATNANVTAPGVDSGFSLRQQDATIRLFDGDDIVAATGTYGTNGSWTTSATAGAAIAAFKAAAASTPRGGLLMMGCGT